MTTADCVHTWRAYTEQEMADLRRLARPGRPPMAWVDAAEQCSSCGRVEATVSWYGQAYRVPVGPKQPGGPVVVQWPTSRGQPSGAGGMGMSEPPR
jgi:hypothetical protein